MSLDFVEAKNVDSPDSPKGYRSTKGLTIAVLVLLSTHALLSLLLSAGWPAALKVLQASENDTLMNGSVGMGDAVAAIAVGVATYLQIAVFIAAAVCFLCWLYRGYSNLPSLGSDRLTTPKSAVVGWLIPFVNLVHGYRSVHELYLESQRPAVLPSGFILPTRAHIVGWWWGLYIARNVSIRIADSALDHVRDGAMTWFWTASVLDIAAAILCMMVVYRIDKRQRDQHDDLVRRAQAPVPTGDSLR
jgi:hypothetical protein